LAVADLDADGDVDAVVGGPGGLALLENHEGRLGVSKFPQGSAAATTTQVGFIAPADVDGDSKLDLLLVCGGRLQLLRNASQAAYPSVVLRLMGSRDSGDAVGSHVELFAGGRYQRRMLGESTGPGGVRFGLGTLALGGI